VAASADAVEEEEDVVEDAVASATVTVVAVEDVAVVVEPVAVAAELAVEETVDGAPGRTATPAPAELLSSRARRCPSTKLAASPLLAFSASVKTNLLHTVRPPPLFPLSNAYSMFSTPV
jgi:hypothetical protein